MALKNIYVSPLELFYVLVHKRRTEFWYTKKIKDCYYFQKLVFDYQKNYVIMISMEVQTAYMKIKEVAKYFDFEEALKREDLPGYIRHYVPADETILVAYKTNRDHGVFTDRKIVLFDHISTKENYKQIYTIPYFSITILSLVFLEESAEVNLSLINGVSLKLNFVQLKPDDKVRLRLLYTCMNRIVNHQECLEEDVRRLMQDDVKLRIKKETLQSEND